MLIRKQAIDQPAHFAWAFVATYIGLMTTQPFGYMFITIHACAIIYREYKQWPSSRWYDPYMDWAFYSAGFITAIAQF